MTVRWGILLAAIAAATGGPAKYGPGRAPQAARIHIRALVEAGERDIDDAAYPAAEAQLRAALALAEGRLGARDGQGRYGEAEALYRKAIGVFERMPGLPPIELAVSLNNLAAIEQARGRLRRAEGLYRRALALKERRWGGDHPDVAMTLNNLAVLCRRQGRRAEAARLYEGALAIFTRALGAGHPKVLACRANYERLLAESGS
jgi:tetratricopeptide (TPR) repeat protein